MELKTVQASALKSCFEVLKDIINDVNVFFTPKGVSIIALDNAKAALINMNLEADRFEEYECEENIKAGINISNFFKILKFITSNDVLTINIKDSDKMKIIIENSTKNSRTNFDLKLLWINEDELQIPAIVTT